MRKLLLLTLIFFMFSCATDKNIRITVDDFKKNYATDKIIFEEAQDYRSIYRKLSQAMQDCYNQPGFMGIFGFGASPNMLVSAQIYDDIKQARIIYGVVRPTAGQQKDIYVEINMVTPVSSRVEIYSWNTNMLDADKVAISIKEFVQGINEKLCGRTLENKI